MVIRWWIVVNVVGEEVAVLIVEAKEDEEEIEKKDISHNSSNTM